MFFATNPKFQGKGYASILLRAMIERVDQEQKPIYLDTDSEKAVQIYEHFDFNVVEQNKIPNTDFNVWLMIRMPKK
jgi:ribosomal protein S18 acetylase RimI-like enzyme